MTSDTPPPTSLTLMMRAMHSRQMAVMDQHRVAGLDTVYYIPNFITEDEEAYLLRKVDYGINPEGLD